VNRWHLEEIRVVAAALSLEFKVIEHRLKRTGGQLRPIVSKTRYRKFEERQDDAWKRMSTEDYEMIHIDLKVSNEIFALEAVLEETDDPGDAMLFSEKKILFLKVHGLFPSCTKSISRDYYRFEGS